MNKALFSKENAKKALNDLTDFEAKNRVSSDMIDISVACLPLIAWGIYVFGARVLTVTLVSVVFCLGFDILMSRLLKSGAPSDMSWLVIGLTSALCMPPSAPIWLPVISSAVSVVFVKHLMAKLGGMRLHPTVCGILVLHMVFPAVMNGFQTAFEKLPAFSFNTGGFTPETTTLGLLFSGSLPEQSMGSVFFGLRSGMIGEVSSFLILAAAAFLLVRRVIDFRLPAVMILVFAVLCYIFPKLAIASDTIALTYTFSHILSGNLLFSLVFLTSYPGASPTVKGPRLMLGALSGILLFVLRYFLSPMSDTLIIILIINLLSGVCDSLFVPSVFGGRIKAQKPADKNDTNENNITP